MHADVTDEIMDEEHLKLEEEDEEDDSSMKDEMMMS